VVNKVENQNYRLSVIIWLAFCILISVVFRSAHSASIEVVKLNNDLDLISIVGPIEYRDDVEFRLKSLGSKKAIVSLISPGGNLDAGLSIGKQIRTSGYSTLVGAKLCASACALTWLGGERRYMTSNAKIGFHAAYVSYNNFARESGMANALVGSYLAKLGLSDDAVIFITSAPPEYLNWLDLRSAQQIGIDVLLVDDGKIIPNWAQPKRDDDNARRAAINFHKRLNKAGMVGLVESIESCYKQVEKKRDIKSIEYCLTLEWCASSFDRSVTKLMKFPRHDYNSEERVIQRFLRASKFIDWGQTNVEAFFRDTTGLAERLVFEDAIINSAK
jgi:hypothetical protein